MVKLTFKKCGKTFKYFIEDLFKVDFKFIVQIDIQSQNLLLKFCQTFNKLITSQVMNSFLLIFLFKINKLLITLVFY